jgi:hypothetical protein
MSPLQATYAATLVYKQVELLPKVQALITPQKLQTCSTYIGAASNCRSGPKELPTTQQLRLQGGSGDTTARVA